MRTPARRALEAHIRNTGATVDNELFALADAVDDFAHEMAAKLFEAHAKGRRGWDDPNCRQGIRYAINTHAARGDGQWVDVANLAMMMRRFESK